MKRIFFIVSILLIASIAIAGYSLSLKDDVLVTDPVMRGCLNNDGIKTLILDGAAGDTVAFYCSGALVKTLTLGSTLPEGYSFDYPCESLKVNWSGSNTVQLYCTY